LASVEENGVLRELGLRVVERGAAHRRAQGRENKLDRSRDRKGQKQIEIESDR